MKFELVGLFSLLSLGSVFGQERALPRPNWHKMTDAARNKFIVTFKKLNEGPRPTTYDRIAGKHPELFPVIHNNARFFAWHRVYLAELERELKKIDPTVSLPYWDWTVYYNNMDQDPIWKHFGKNGNPRQGNCVTDGQFANFQSIYYADSRQKPSAHCSRRESNIPKVFSARKEDLIREVIDNGDHQSFSRRMEGGGHANVHIGIGWDFAQQASANEPMFWLHHAFVDKIWNDRQQKHKDWFTGYPNGPCDLPTYTETCKDTFDTRKYGYYYEEDNFSWAVARSLGDAPSREPEPFTPISNNRTVSDEAINKYATQYVLKDILLPHNVSPDKVMPGCELLNLPAAMPIKNVRMMGYDEAEIRHIERSAALSVDDHNRDCLI